MTIIVSLWGDKAINLRNGTAIQSEMSQTPANILRAGPIGTIAV